MAAIQQLAHSLWRRKEKAPKATASDDEDENENSEEEEEEESDKIRDALFQQAENSSESASTTATATPESSKKKQPSRSSRWDRQRRFRSEKGQEDEKLKKRSRSLITSLFTDAFSSATSSPRQSAKANGEVESKRKHSVSKNMAAAPPPSAAYHQRGPESAQVAVTSSSPAFVVQQAQPQQQQQQQQPQTLPLLGKAGRNSVSASNVQAFVAKFSGKASAMVTPMPATNLLDDFDRRSTMTVGPSLNDCNFVAKPMQHAEDRSLPTLSFKSLIDSKLRFSAR